MSQANPARIAILTVSDTASTDAATDKSGPTIRDIVTQRGFRCLDTCIVPDDIPIIQAKVQDWCDSGEIDWIITTGGTGFGVRDKTPEAISSLLERQASGIVHLLLSASLKHTPLAALSRPVAGTRKNTLVVTLPGSVKAVRENLDALLSGGVIDHAIDLVRGGSGQQVHASLAAAQSRDDPAMGTKVAHLHGHYGHHDHHHHHAPRPRANLSHDPANPVSARHRVSPYPLISFEAALEKIFSQIKPLPTAKIPVGPSLKGYVVAEDVFAPQDVPSTKTTSVDGYALRSADSPSVYDVVTSATHKLQDILSPQTIYRINTGGALPEGTDTVIMVEDTVLVSTHHDGEEKQVQTLAQVPPGENVREPGSDVRKGALVLEKGERILSSGGEIGTLCFVGRKEVEVYRKPIVALLSTGDEITDISSDKNDSYSSWDTNRPSLQAALEGLGYKVLDLGIVPDNIAAHESAIRKGIDGADLILTTGGTSMGPSDLLKPVIERNFNGTIHFGRVTIKPGKPTTFATIPTSSGVDKPLFALPGNPASALVTFHVFVLPALRLLGGWPIGLCQFPRVKVKAQEPLLLDTRTEFHRVMIRTTSEGLVASSTGGQRSSRVASLNGANGFLILPQRTDQRPAKLPAGSSVDAIVIGELLNA
ncbi:hypothetical protein HGRIS_010081 [Hohenbuehelia grisea]|uniref:MoaB/Mog domain-containing protein n=1 Tax=Hohenbuehelia grisea TaxID=104357 RepID=A0ABR3J373_9AGAR